MLKKIFLFLLCSLPFSLTPGKILANSRESILNKPNPFCENLEKVLPAVVFIAIETNPFETSYFRFFYEWAYPPDFSHGSGFIISEDGYVVTNAHVTENATNILIVMPQAEQKIWKVSLVGSDIRSDISVLKIENPDNFIFPYLTFANSNHASLGEEIVVVGSPISEVFESTITKGIISAKERNNFGYPIEGFIQIDAPVNCGNSGGPVLNSNGNVIGVIKFGCSHFSGIKGITFAIPSNVAQSVAQQIISNGKISQGFLGIELEKNIESAFEYYYFDCHDGAYIKTVLEPSPAYNAGLQIGDIILEMNGLPIRSAQSLKNQLGILEPNTIIHLKIKRSDTIKEISIKLGDEGPQNFF